MRAKSLFLPLLFIAAAGCRPMPQLNVSPARLLQTQTAVRDGQGNEVSAVGYLLLTFGSDSDLAALAAARGAFLWQSAETCDSRVELDSWPYVFDSDGQTYSALVAFKSTREAAYNLAVRPEDLCIRVGFGGTMNPLDTRSRTIRYPVNDALREELRMYEARGGQVELQPSPTCPTPLCRPRPNTP